MHEACGFDMTSSSQSTSKNLSDCYTQCINGGCSDTLLGNGVCDSGDFNLECNISECGWDWGDCGYCSQDCRKSDLAQGCKSECKNELCFFNNGLCVISNQDGNSWCSQGCTREMVENSSCDQTCHNTNCGYDNGRCTTCMEWMKGDGKCDESCNNAENNYDEWDCSCSIQDNSSLENPFSIYVFPTRDSSYTSQNGTKNRPFRSLSIALHLIMHQYSRIYLMRNCTEPHLLDSIDSSNYPQELFHPEDINDPLGSSLNERKSIEIIPLRCDSNHDVEVGRCYNITERAEIRWTGENPIAFHVSDATELHISDVNLNGFNPMITSPECNTELCTYCPNYNITEGKVLDDRGDYYNIFEYGTNCKRFDKYELFKVEGTLRLTNVKIYNWRAQFGNIIAVDSETGTVNLTNVEFENIIVNFDEDNPGVISFKGCETKYECGTLEYNGGKVSLLNNGFEYNDASYYAGFFYAMGLKSFNMTGVTFEYNLVYKGATAATSNSIIGNMIYIENYLQFSVTNCTFRYNLMSSSIIFLKMSLPYTQIPLTATKNYNDYTIDHITFINNTFANNIGSVLYSNSDKHHPNIYMTGNSIKNSVFLSSATYNGYIDILYNGDHKDAHEEWDNYISTNKIEREYSKTYMGVLEIDTCYSDSYLLYMKTLFDVKFENLSIKNSPQIPRRGKVEYEVEWMFKDFIAHNNTYTSKEINFVTLPHGKQLAYIQECYGLAIKNLTLANNYSLKGSTALNIYIQDQNFTLDSALIQNNTANGLEGYGLYLAFSSTSKSFNFLKNIIAINNTNTGDSGYGVIYAKSDKEGLIDLRDSLFKSNTAHIGAAAYISMNLTNIQNIEFINNTLSKLTGAALHLEGTSSIDSTLNALGYASMNITISDCIFDSNRINSGSGVVYIGNSYGTDNIHKLAITNSTFRSNLSKSDSSTLFISKTVRLSNDSLVSNSQFLNNTSNVKGNIFLSFYNGTLTFSNCSFIENISNQGINLFILTDTPAKVVVNQSEFRSNRNFKSFGSSLIDLADSTIRSYLETHDCIFTNNTSTAVRIDNGVWVDYNSVFTENNVEQAAVLYNINTGSAILNSSTAASNTSKRNGGVVAAGNESSIKIKGGVFRNNTSGESGGVGYFEQRSVMKIDDSTFSDNSALHKGSGLYLALCDKLESYISTSTFFENKSVKGGSIVLLSSNLEIFKSKIYSNTDQTSTSGIILTLSYLNITSSDFYSQYGIVGGSIYVSTESTVNIYDCTFKNSNVTRLGGAIFGLSSNINIYDSEFSNLQASAAGVVLAYTSSELNMQNVTASNIDTNEAGSIVKAFESKVTISDSNFDRFDSTGIDGNSLYKLEVRNSEIRSGVGKFAGGIFCSMCNEIYITDTQFFNNTADKGGAVYVYRDNNSIGSNPLIISGCEFRYNTAIDGGAIYSENLSLELTRGTFEYNSANKSEIEGNGGAISIQCSDLIYCSFDIYDNTFRYNSATKNGGAINWADFKPNEYNNTHAHNAAKYGPYLASFGVKLVKLHLSSNATTLTEDRLLLENGYEIHEVPPGQKNEEDIVIAMVDVYDQVVTTAESVTCDIITNNSSELYITGTTKVTVYEGLFDFNNYEIFAKPGSSSSIRIQSSGMDGDDKNRNNITVVNLLDIKVNLRACIMGESTSAKECIVCEPGKYSLNPEDETCKACPTEATCYGSYNIVPNPGFWRQDMHSDLFYECLNKAVCLGSPEAPDIYSYSGDCAIGYTGPLCQACQNGYSRTSKNECGVCPDAVGNAMKLTGILIAVIIVCVVMVKTTMDSAYKQKSLQSIYIKILFNYLQLVMLTATFDLDWPEYVLEVFSVQEKAGSATDQIFSVDCFISDKGGVGYTSEDVYYFKLVIMLALPILIVTISVFVWSCIAFYKRSIKYLKLELMATIVILVFLVHPNIVKAMFSAFSCMEIEGESWLLENLEIKCWDAKHFLFATSVALPGIIFWGLGIPTACLLYLFRHRRHLNTISIRLKFGFLFNGYKQTHFYWEFLILYRKIFIIFCSVFLSNLSVPLQALTVMIVLLISLHIQSISNPYSHASLNEMETRSILVAAVTIYCGLYYLTGDLSEISKFGFFVMIVGSNAYFLYYWQFRFLEVSMVSFISKIPCLRRRLAKGLNDGFDDEMFINSPIYTNVVRKDDNILYTFRRLSDRKTEMIESLPDAKSIELYDMKNLYMNVVRSKNTFTYKKEIECNILEITNLEEIMEESCSESL